MQSRSLRLRASKLEINALQVVGFGEGRGMIGRMSGPLQFLKGSTGSPGRPADGIEEFLCRDMG